ncbi:MAG: endonuclease [Bacilli bacterium]|nr:endonuclease [Bacilli bacterium]
MKKKNIFLAFGMGTLLASSLFAFNAVNHHDAHQEVKVVEAADVDKYYQECEGLTGTALKAKLKSILNNGISVSYDWERYEDADEDVNNTNNIVTIYARTSLAKSAHVSGSIGWNREHTFPQSKMSAAGSKSDNHIIFASDNKVNGIRGSKRLAELTNASKVYDCYGNPTPCTTNSSYFDPGDTQARGLVARSTMYAEVLYDYEIDENVYSYAKCLEWHFKYYPTATIDIRRNDVVYGNQHNRNPFVDHPEYAAYIWGDHDAECRAICEQYLTTLTDLTLTGEAVKTVYKPGESFNTEGVTVTAEFTDGNGNKTYQDVTGSIEWSPSAFAVGDTKAIGSFTYFGVTKTVEYDGIAVLAPTNITYEGSLIKTDYFVGDTFSPIGLSFYLNFNDGTHTALGGSEISWPALVNGMTSITGTYSGLSVTVSGITVSNPMLSELYLTGTLAKAVYNEGDTFDPTGLHVYARYTDGKAVEVTQTVTWTPNPLKTGDTRVIATYEGHTIAIDDITVNKKKKSGGCSGSITSNSSIVFIGGIALLVIAIRMAYKAKKER